MAYKLSPEEEKEAIDFLTRFVGGTQDAIIDNFFRWYNTTYQAGQPVFPFNRLEPHMPQNVDIIIAGVSMLEALLGLGIEEDPLKLLENMDYRAKEQTQKFGSGLRKFGEGAVLYSVPMVTRRTIIHNIPSPTPAAAPTRQETQQPTSGRVIKL